MEKHQIYVDHPQVYDIHIGTPAVYRIMIGHTPELTVIAQNLPHHVRYSLRGDMRLHIGCGMRSALFCTWGGGPTVTRYLTDEDGAILLDERSAMLMDS